MHIRISVDVNEGLHVYGGPRGEGEVSLTTQAKWPESLPWAEICCNLVETAIEDYRAKEKAEKEGATE